MTNLAEQIDTNIIVNNTPVSNTTTTTNTSSSVTSNIVGVFIDKPIVQINQFVKRDKTENTTKTYINHYSDMFMFICHKQLNNLTWDDIKNISLSQAKEYRDFLIEQDFASSTINQRIFACKALWDDFFENEKVSKNVFNLKKLKQINNSYDSLTDKEIQLLLDFCMEEKQKPQTKKLYFEFLYTTALRKNIAQTITIDDIKRKLDIKHQKEYWVIEVMDKEHQRNIGILDEFYNRLINNAENQKYNDNKLFHLDNHTADKVLKNFCKKYGINRNIVQHSVKSSSGDLVQNVFQDIKKTAKHLGHTNIQTSYEYYLGKNESYAEQPSVLLQENYNINMLKGLGEDVLIKIIEQYTEKHGRDLLIKMCMELNELTK